MNTSITAVGIVVPAHNEEALLGACLRSIALARAYVQSHIETWLVVVLDACTDSSRSVASRAHGLPFEFAEVDSRNVGYARASGMRHALAHLAQHRSDQTWLVTTDADCEVPESWLDDHVALADRGARAVAGTVSIRDWSGHSLSRMRAFDRFYMTHNQDGAHAHVHGANFGVRADAYLDVGGFAPLTTGEDHALQQRLLRRSHRIVATRDIPVTTSSRVRGRAPRGFANFIAALEP